MEKGYIDGKDCIVEKDPVVLESRLERRRVLWKIRGGRFLH